MYCILKHFPDEKLGECARSLGVLRRNIKAFLCSHLDAVCKNMYGMLQLELLQGQTVRIKMTTHEKNKYETKGAK